MMSIFGCHDAYKKAPEKWESTEESSNVDEALGAQSKEELLKEWGAYSLKKRKPSEWLAAIFPCLKDCH